MIRFRFFFTVLTSTLVASCSLFGPADSRLAELTLTPSDSVTAPPTTVRFSGINDSGVDLLYGVCSAELQRLMDGVWSARDVSSGMCSAVGINLYAGDRISFGIPIVNGISVGTYRARLHLMAAVGNRPALAVSTPFRIQ